MSNILSYYEGRSIGHEDSSEESEVEYLLNVLSEDKARSLEEIEDFEPGSDLYERSSDSLNRDISFAASDGFELISELPISILYIRSPACESTSNEETPWLETETPKPAISTNTSPPSFTLPISSNLVLLADQPVSFACNSCSGNFPNASQLVDHIVSSHYQDGRYHCSKCNVDIGLKKDLQRHFETTETHRLSAIRCRCSLSFGRKDKFCEHLQRKKPCDSILSFSCFCGHRIESSSPDSTNRILEHIKPCGQRKRGRPKR
jgi:hypothetical protein